jgi:MFS family permease
VFNIAQQAFRAFIANRWCVLAMITGMMMLNQVDRYVLSVVVEPVKHEFHLSDAAMGTLSGLAHSVALAIFVLPLGWLADRTNRVKLISIILTVWSLLTALASLAGGYRTLLLIRFGVGAAEAGGPPAAVSLISDLFSARERPTAMGFYYVHAAVGTGLVFLVGGYIAEHFGWRSVFLLAGIPGLLLALLMLFTIREPARNGGNTPEAPAKTRDITRMAMTNRTLQFMLVAGSMATIAQTSVWSWMGSIFIRQHGMTLTQIGILIAVSAGAAKGVGSAMTGPLVRYFSGDVPRHLWRFPAMMLCLSVPICWAMTSSPKNIAIVFAIILGAVLGCWPAPAMVIIVTGVPSQMRATSTSLYQLMTNLIGAGGGPVLTGLLSDAFGRQTGLGRALSMALSVNFLAAIAFYAASRTLPDKKGLV